MPRPSGRHGVAQFPTGRDIRLCPQEQEAPVSAATAERLSPQGDGCRSAAVQREAGLLQETDVSLQETSKEEPIERTILPPAGLIADAAHDDAAHEDSDDADADETEA